MVTRLGAFSGRLPLGELGCRDQEVAGTACLFITLLCVCWARVAPLLHWPKGQSGLFAANSARTTIIGEGGLGG